MTNKLNPAAYTKDYMTKCNVIGMQGWFNI